MRKKVISSVVVLGALALLGAGCINKNLKSTAPMAKDPSILVSDQALTASNQLIIDGASLGDDGWVVIHEKQNGQPGPIIGYTSLLKEIGSKIKITIDKTNLAPSLIAMLHYDRGQKGVFEFPGADGPVIKDQQVIMKEFKLLNFIETAKETSANDMAVARKEFVVTLKQWSFSPSVITVKKDDVVTLKLRSVDVTHSLALPNFNINVNVKAGETKTVEFKADKIGSFNFVCGVYCGVGHGGMTGKLIVE